MENVYIVFHAHGYMNISHPSWVNEHLCIVNILSGPVTVHYREVSLYYYTPALTLVKPINIITGSWFDDRCLCQAPITINASYCVVQKEAIIYIRLAIDQTRWQMCYKSRVAVLMNHGSACASLEHSQITYQFNCDYVKTFKSKVISSERFQVLPSRPIKYCHRPYC